MVTKEQRRKHLEEIRIKTLESYLSKMIYARKEKQEASGDNQEQSINF